MCDIEATCIQPWQLSPTAAALGDRPQDLPWPEERVPKRSQHLLSSFSGCAWSLLSPWEDWISSKVLRHETGMPHTRHTSTRGYSAVTTNPFKTLIPGKRVGSWGGRYLPAWRRGGSSKQSCLGHQMGHFWEGGRDEITALEGCQPSRDADMAFCASQTTLLQLMQKVQYLWGTCAA